MEDGRPPLIQLATGVGLALAVLATLVVPLWTIELGLVGLSVWFLAWILRAPVLRLASTRRIPRLMIFAPLGVGVAVNLHLVNMTSRPALAVNLLIFLAALIGGLLRVFRAPVPPWEPSESIPEQQ